MTVTKIVPRATLLILCRRARHATKSTHRRVTELAAHAGWSATRQRRATAFDFHGRFIEDHEDHNQLVVVFVVLGRVNLAPPIA